jgi:phage terminase large subunit GpA-like protein
MIDYARSLLIPSGANSVKEWAEKSVFLSERVTEQSGLYSTEHYPYVEEILENMRDPRINKISLCWGSQTSKTTSFYIMLGYVIDQKPQPILWVFPNQLLCKSFSYDRWMPFCKESKIISNHIPRDKTGNFDSDKFTIQKQEFTKCTMNLVGAGSSANVRSFPVSVLVLDEIDVIDEFTRKECLDRIKGRRNYKILQSSTPVKELSGIWSEYQDGDRRRFYVPCPHCENKFFYRLFNKEDKLNLKWDENAVTEEGVDFDLVKSSTFYVCEECGAELNDLDKYHSIRKGEWVAGNSKAESSNRSYHLNSFYSPQITFGRIAIEYLKSKKNVESEMAFYNGWLAEPYREFENTASDIKKIKELESDYEKGDLKGEFRFISVDVQRANYFYVIRGFDSDGKSYLIENGIAFNFDELNELAKAYKCTQGIVDTGYRTQEMYQEIYASMPFWFGAKGIDNMTTSYKISQLDPFYHDQRRGKRRINLININKEVWQQEMLKKRSGQTLDWFLYKNLDSEYIKQILSTDYREEVNRKGQSKLQWVVAPHKQDHFWDCETYILCLAHIFGLGAGLIRRKKKEVKKASKKKTETEPSIWD